MAKFGRRLRSVFSRATDETMQGQSPSWTCAMCGATHMGLATVFGAPAPLPWLLAKPEDRVGVMNADVCHMEVDGKVEHYIRGHIEIPIRDADGAVFAWSAWVSISDASEAELAARWDDPTREAMPPQFGWLSTALDYEPPTVGLATSLHQRRPGLVPLIELHPETDHPLVREQVEGITLHRVAELNTKLLGR